MFGRGAVDNKFDVSMITATLANLKRSGWKPGRDVLFALSGDEETSMVSTRKLAQEIKNAELVLNDDGGGGLLAEDTGKPIVYGIQAAEKVYADFTLTMTDPGGHSSRPGKTNAINQLVRALQKIADYRFRPCRTRSPARISRRAPPMRRRPLGEAMTRFLADPNDAKAIETLSDSREYIGQVRTTCIATMLSGGHAQNALPQRATANINCRIFPGTPVASVRETLAKVIDDRGREDLAGRSAVGRRRGVTSAA